MVQQSLTLQARATVAPPAAPEERCPLTAFRFRLRTLTSYCMRIRVLWTEKRRTTIPTPTVPILFLLRLLSTALLLRLCLGWTKSGVLRGVICRRLHGRRGT